MAGNVLEFTTQNFPKEVLESSQVVMVDFWYALVRPVPDAGSDD